LVFARACGTGWQNASSGAGTSESDCAFPSEWEPRVLKLQQMCPQAHRSLVIKALMEHNGIAAEALAAIRTEARGENEPSHEPEVATQKHFHSQMEEVFQCGSCGQAQVVKNDLCGLSLPIPADGHTCELKDMLATYFQNESHSLRCASCGVVTPHTLHKKLLSRPPVLILHIKRDAQKAAFSNYYNYFSTSMRRSDVNIPTVLGGTHECPSVYRLRSVVARSGLSTESGHYTCHVRDESDAWTNFNDAHVSSRYSNEQPQSLGRNAHILFYALDQDEEAQWTKALALSTETSSLKPRTQEDEEEQYRQALALSLQQAHSETQCTWH
jgi:hypothetical protein